LCDADPGLCCLRNASKDRISRKSPKKRSIERGFLQACHPGYG
jgi:hypothetical protein